MSSITLITGATSGIGQLVVERLGRDQRRTDLVISGPCSTSTDALAQKVGAHAFSADLASLAEVRRLVERIVELGQQIDLLILVAGRQALDDKERSPDDIECSFAVNAVSNVALIDGLIAAGRIPRRVILFSSATHDPTKKAGLPTPRHSNVALLAHPENDTAAQGDKPSVRGNRAYSSSKLAVAMLAAAYARAYPDMRIDAIDPQLTPGTGLARRQSAAVRFLWHNLLPLFVPLLPFMNRPTAVADATIALANDDGVPVGSGRYVEVRRGRPIIGRASELARDEAAQDRLLADIRALAA